MRAKRFFHENQSDVSTKKRHSVWHEVCVSLIKARTPRHGYRTCGYKESTLLNKILVVEDEQLLAQNLRDYLAAQGLDVASGTPEQFDKLIRAEIDKWRKLVQVANIRVE